MSGVLGLAWAPRFVVNETDYSFELPMQPPDPEDGGVGGSETAAAGLPASYGVRDDYLLGVNLRFFEHEWPEVEALVLEMQKHFAPIEFFPDADNEYGPYSCYLEEPVRGSRWKPTRDANYPAVFNLSILLRSIQGPFSILYYEDVLDA